MTLYNLTARVTDKAGHVTNSLVPVNIASIGTIPNPSLLPVATGQVLNTAAYTALDLKSKAAGFSYLDPTTGVTVVKLTTPTSPVPGTATWMCGVDYGSGGCRIGRPTNGVYPIVVTRSPNGTHDYHLITFNINTLEVGYRCPLPGGTREIARAMSLTTPNIFYSLDGSGGILHKYNVSGSSAVEITGGVWPKNLSAFLHGQVRFIWLQTTTDDRYFCMMAGEAGTWVVLWDSQTDTVKDHNFASFDEPKLSKDSPFVHATGHPTIWDYNANVERTAIGTGSSYLGHNDTLRQYAFGSDGNTTGGLWYIDLENFNPSLIKSDMSYYIGNLYTSGGWVDQTSDLTQWALLGYQPYVGNDFANEKMKRSGLGLERLNASGGLHLLCHSYGLGNVNGTQDYYCNSLWPNMSPDGRFCLFKSNMNTILGFSSLFAAILPTS